MQSSPVQASNIYTFNPDHIAHLIADNDWAGCWEYLAGIVENLTLTATTESLNFSIQLQSDMKQESGKKYVKDIGGLLGELFLYLLSNRAAIMSDKSFYRIIIFHETIHSLFYVNGMADTDAAVRELLGDGKKKLTTSDQKKLLLLLSLETEIDLDVVLKAVDPSYRTAAVIAYYSHRKIFRKNVYLNKEKLQNWRREFEKSLKMPPDLFMSNVTAYFLCSYMNTPNKHLIKESVNSVCRQYLATLNSDFKRIAAMQGDPFGLKIDSSKPTVLVVTELFARNHAMYRGWGKLTRSLHSEFNVVFTMPHDRVDEGLRTEYENFHPFGTLGDLYHLICVTKPDIIFMPSIGMRFYNIIMSTMRFAPIQIMGLGHPATSMSDYIDYVVSPSGIYDPAAFPKDIYIGDGYPEKHVPLLPKDQFFAPLPVEEHLPRPANKKIIYVGVVGSDIKISYPFFSLLKEIVAESPFEIHVLFMMGVGGIDSLYIERYLEENFKNSTYFGWQVYADYLKNIKKVDIILNPFPFGHTNTIIDTLMCGKPCVGLEGVEPASRTERDVLNAVGLKDMFIAKSETEYKEKFFSLAEKILNGQTEFYDREDIHARIFADMGDYDYGKVLKWIYDNDKKLKASGKKYFDVFTEV